VVVVVVTVTVVVVVFVFVVFVLLTGVLVVVEPGTLVVAVDVGPATLAVLVFVTVLIRGTRTVLVCVMSTCCVRVQTPE
jgi:hypothetical protein